MQSYQSAYKVYKHRNPKNNEIYILFLFNIHKLKLLFTSNLRFIINIFHTGK